MITAAGAQALKTGAELVELRDFEDRRRPVGATDGGARILLFTGVRYERIGEPAPARREAL